VSVSRPVRTGRRPGASSTRDEIAAAARAAFAEVGYDRASLRGIARAARVDPALVMHFFGSKEGLFREVMTLPGPLAAALAAVAQAPRSEVGRRLAELVVSGLESPELRGILLGRIRSAASHPEAAALVREVVERDLHALAAAIGGERPELRAALVGAHLVGFAVARYVVLVEPMASLTPEQAVDVLAPQFQQALVDPLS